MPVRLNAYHITALTLVFLSITLSAFFSSRVFERLPHLEDEVTYLFQAKMLARGDFTVETPQPRRAYWQPFVLDRDGTRFGKYPPGWPLLLSIGVNLGQWWVVNAFLGGLTVALVYRLGSDLFDPDAGLIAAALVTFSPMALLLNASLMGHTAALFFTTAFAYAYYRLERDKPRAFWWGVVAGLSLGVVAITRPLTALGVAAPFVLWSVLRLLWTLFDRPLAFMRRLLPLVALGLCAILVSFAIPLHNRAAVGDPTQNLYLLVWDYDRIGFGEDYGRSGHTLEKGIRHARFDLTLMTADLFGWQLERLDWALYHFFREGSGNYDGRGISYVLLPLGLLVGLTAYRRNWQWTLLLLGIAAALLTVQLAYWIGSHRYSTRYYFESLAALALVSALPLAWLARRFSKQLVYALLSVVLLYSFFSYSVWRIGALYRYNFISQAMVDGVESRRVDPDTPVLVLVNGESVRWRALGTFMALTSPYLDSEIVGAWNYNPDNAAVREGILANHPGWQVIEIDAEGNIATFRDEGVLE